MFLESFKGNELSVFTECVAIMFWVSYSYSLLKICHWNFLKETEKNYIFSGKCLIILKILFFFLGKPEADILGWGRGTVDQF